MAPMEEFKPREIEILNFMAQGYSNQEIADQLFITKGTVRWYNKIIYSKLGTSRRTEAIAFARELGLIGDTPSDENASQKRPILPVTTGPFVGRDDELTDLQDLLTKPDIRLVSIVAAGGMGKSRLALELGHLIQADYEHGAIFIDLTALRNPNDIAVVTLTTLGLTTSDSQSPQETLLNYCREKELLLIFDNFEHVLKGADLLSDILTQTQRVQIIVTSREQLNLIAETVYYLHPVSEFGETLFIELAHMMRPTIVISEAEKSDIVRIVNVTGGLPLGLVLAATWVDMLSIAEIANEIEANLEFLSAELGDIPERQHSMHALIDPTWNRLNEVERQAFMKASVFRGGFTRELFQQVTGASLRTLQTLGHRSLISHGHGRRYVMHPLLRQYAREKLEMDGHVDEVKNTHLRALADYAENQATLMYRGSYIEALNALDIEQDNMRAALDWSMNDHQVENGVRLVLALCDFWLIRSQAREGAYYVGQALQHQEKASLYYWMGMYTERMGQREVARSYQQQCITLAQKEENYDFLALGYREMGSVFSILTHEQASAYRDYLLKALDISNKFGSPKVQAVCHTVAGNFKSYIDDNSTEALTHHEKALHIYEQIGDLRGISMATYNMAIQYDYIGEKQLAYKYCTRSLNIKRKIGDKAGEARRLSILADWDITNENLDRAQNYLTESRVICEELGEQARLVYTLVIEGFLNLIQQNFSSAQAILEKVLAIAESVEDFTMLWSAKAYLAMLFMAQNEVERARPYIIEIIRIRSAKSDTNWLSLIVYAHYLWHLKEAEDCLDMLSVLYNHGQTSGVDNRFIKYFLQPLIDEVQEYFSKDVWEFTCHQALGKNLEQLHEELLQNLDL